jgi:hypothetical protein
MNLLENTTLEVSDITAWDQNEQKLLVSKGNYSGQSELDKKRISKKCSGQSI